MSDRRMNIAIAIISGGIDRVKVEPELAIKALDFIIQKACGLRDQLTGFQHTGPRVASTIARVEEDAKHEAWLSTPAGKTAAKVHEDQKREARLKVASDKKDATIGRKVVASLFENIKIQGRAIGGIWYHELEAMHQTSVFETKLITSLMRHGKPDKPTRIRDMLSEKMLAGMVKAAKQE